MSRNAVASTYLEEMLQFVEFNMGMYEVVKTFKKENAWILSLFDNT